MITAEKIEQIKEEINAKVGAVSSSDELAAVWQEYLSKGGQVTLLSRELGKLTREDRPVFGKLINESAMFFG